MREQSAVACWRKPLVLEDDSLMRNPHTDISFTSIGMTEKIVFKSQSLLGNNYTISSHPLCMIYMLSSSPYAEPISRNDHHVKCQQGARSSKRAGGHPR
jgi:hypothetical protein